MQVGVGAEARRGAVPKRGALLVPVLLDLQVPLPREVVCLVVVCEVGLDVVASPHKHSLGSLLHRGQELVLLSPGPVATHHVHSLVHCGANTEE